MFYFSHSYRASFFNRIASWIVAGKTIPQGAATTVWACVAPQVDKEDMQGAYLDNCKAVAPSTDKCRDLNGEWQEKLWKGTEKDLAAALSQAGLPEVPSI
jgi:hypothetical protein